MSGSDLADSMKGGIMGRDDVPHVLKLRRMEASYLAWIDCTKSKHQNPYQVLLEAGLATSPGEQFNRDKFVRLNFGTQRQRLKQALEILQSVFS